MEYEKLVVNDKGEKVSVAEKQTLPVNPQLFPYLLCLFGAAHFLSFLITVRPSESQNKESPFGAHGGCFTIIAIVSISLVVVASAILIFASHYMQSWMKDVHYVILKTIGCFSTINALFSLGAAFLVPENLNSTVYLVMASICVCILTSDYLLWKYVCTQQQNKLCNTFPLHWSFFLTPLFPLSVALWKIIPPSLFSTWYLVTWGSFIVGVAASYSSWSSLLTQK